MKSKYLGLLLFAVTLHAQTVVTATVVDSDSITWSNGNWILNYSNSSGQLQSGTLNGAGQLTVTVNTGLQYRLVVCPNASSACGSYLFTAIGTSMNVSTGINAIITAPRFKAVSGAYGYADIEAQISLTPGSQYWNVTSVCMRTYDGSTWACPSGGVPTGMVAFIASGTCPTGWTENTSLDGNYILATTTAHGDVGHVGGSSAYTPLGTVSASTFTGTPSVLTGNVAASIFTGSLATLTGSITAPTFTGGAFTLTGSVAAPSFTGNAATLTGSVAAPSFTGSSATLTGSVAAPTFTGSSSNLSFGAMTFTGNAGTVPAQVFTGSAGTVPAQTFTGNSVTSSAVSGGTPAGTNSGAAFSVTTVAETTGSGNFVAKAMGGTTLASGTTSITLSTQPTFAGSVLATHTHATTATGTNSTSSFTPVGINGTATFTPTGTVAIATSTTTAAGTNNSPALTMNSYTPAGSNSVPALTMNSYTPGGSNGIPALTMNSYTPSGTNSIPSLSMNSYTPSGTNNAPALTMNSYTPSGSLNTPTFNGTANATAITPLFFKMIPCSKN